MSVGTTAAIAIAAGVGAAGSIGGSLISSHAAGKASDQQAEQAQNAIGEQRYEFDRAQQNSQPFIQAGQSSIGQIMDAIKSGKFGAGSTGAAPADFHAPTLAEVQQTPGYEFALQQGNKGILAASAATGGAISGGTSKALQGYGVNLANSTYGDAFNRSMQQYQASLAGYGSRLAGQQQEFSQLLAPAQIGSGANANLNATGQSSASSISSLMQSLGASQAAGTVGSANALAGGIGGATNSISQGLLLSKLLGGPSGGLGTTNLNPQNPVFSQGSGDSTATLGFPG